MRILFIGDVVAQPGRRFLKTALRQIRSTHAPDLVVVNGENAAGGHGITPQTATEIFRAGADVITTGNHVWDRGEIVTSLDRESRLLRPENYPSPAPGGGIHVGQARDGTPFCVINLMGRVFMSDVDDPFRMIDEILLRLNGEPAIVIVDFHAEATSEKVAFGWHVDGRVSAVVGTHTHVPTADARVLPGGTAYITDVGMTGPYDSVIGADKHRVLERFRTQRPVRLCPGEGDVRLAAVLIDVAPHNGRARSIQRIELRKDADGDAE